MTEEPEETEDYTVTDFVREIQIDFEGAATAAEAIGKIGPDHRQILDQCDAGYRAKFEDLVTTLFNLQSEGKDALTDETAMAQAKLVFEDETYWNAMADLVCKQIYQGVEETFMDELEQAWGFAHTTSGTKPSLH